jgi:S1-C subfamily serine protease
MFDRACKKNRKSIYGVLCKSPLPNNQVNFGTGTAFMIAPGICATAAHVLHVEGDKSKPLHKYIEVIRTPDIGNKMLTAKLIAEDIDRDLALIEINNPTDISILHLHKNKLSIGLNCGALGFPLASIAPVQNQVSFNLVERFQGAYISAFQKLTYPNNIVLDAYETDSLMYSGSSGCPGFDSDGNVFGMHVATVSEGTAKNNASRLAISLWVPSMDIISFSQSKGVKGIQVV